jgi:hypothetical protein
MDFDQVVGVITMAIDAIKRGDIDEVQIMREWSDHAEETTEGFQLILTRDVIARHESERLDDVIKRSTR